MTHRDGRHVYAPLRFVQFVSPRPRVCAFSSSALAPALIALVLFASPHEVSSQTSCCAGGPLGPLNCNVGWNTTDSLTACPASDSVYWRLARLYIQIHYEDNNCNPRVGVPPESVWVTYQTMSGNLVLNDMGPKVFADEPTNVNGDTRITLHSFSGCGTIRCNLFVSGKNSGFKDVLVRTTDADGTGRFESTETAGCDLNYDGVLNLQDRGIGAPHLHHWHRNALYGTLVRRTNTRPSAGRSRGHGQRDHAHTESEETRVPLRIRRGPCGAT